jgi:hypothetical protein
MEISWCDAGMNADGDIYALWYGVVTPEEGEAWAGIWLAKSMEEGWSEPFQVTDAARTGHASYPHMTTNVGDYLFIIHMIEGETDYENHIARVDAGLTEVTMSEGAVALSATDIGYYIDAVDPIAQDVTNGWVYFVVRSAVIEEATGVTIGSSSDMGETWSTETIIAAQRYPSVRLDEANMTPYIFSNYGVPAVEPGESTDHYSWYIMDEGGYGGGLWSDRVDYMSATYPGELLYTANGCFTTEGRFVAGCNIWSYDSPDYPIATPWAYGLVYTDDGGSTWSDKMVLYNGVEDDLLLATLEHGSVYAGASNTVFFTWAATSGENDLVAPEFRDWVTLSSTEPGEPWVVSCLVSDDVGVIYSDINWAIMHPDSAATEWAWTDGNDSTWVHDEATNSGLFWYTMPSDSMHGTPVTEVEMVWFYIFAMDQTNQVQGPTFSFVPGEEWMSAPREDYTPVEFGLASNYPNPFNNSTMIPFSVDRAVDARVAIYDVNGRLIDIVFDGSVTAGQHTVAWHAQNVVSGVYFYSLEVNGSKFMRKMTLVH